MKSFRKSVLTQAVCRKSGPGTKTHGKRDAKTWPWDFSKMSPRSRKYSHARIGAILIAERGFTVRTSARYNSDSI